ncbi:hypothetical protein KO317_02515 [Candidatus Micrarchaeota archaeon]|nr:hypothetical protein [Candidatus Micrarchaeota archaeon]
MKNINIIILSVVMLLLISISYSNIIPQKYKTEVHITDVSLKGHGSINANFTWRNVSLSSDQEYLKEYSQYQWYFTPLLSAKNPLANKEIKIYVSETMPDFYLCSNKITNSNGQLIITDFNVECGKNLSEYAAIKFVFLGSNEYGALEHIFYVSNTPFTADSFNSLYLILVKVISDVNRNPLCIFVIILSGIIFAAMFFQGDNPLQVFDITQPRLPKAMEGLGGIVGKIKLEAKAGVILNSHNAAKATAKVAALSASVYSVSDRIAKKERDKDKSNLLSTVRNNKRLNSLQKIYLYQLISRGELARARKMINGSITLPSDYIGLSKMIAYESSKSPIELRQAYLRKKLLEKQIGYYDKNGVFIEGKYVKSLMGVGVTGTMLDSKSNKLIEGAPDGKGGVIKSPIYVGKVRRVPLVGLSVSLGQQVLGGFKKDITDSLKFWKNPAKGFKSMIKKNYEGSLGVVVAGSLKPLSVPIESPSDMMTKLKRTYVEHDLYKGMNNSIILFTGKNYGEISNPKGKKNTRDIEKILVFDELSRTQKNQLIKELEQTGYLTKGEININTQLTERKRVDIILRLFKDIKFRKTAGAESKLLLNTYSEINATLDNYERNGNKYDFAQVNYVRSLARRYDAAKLLLDSTRGKKEDKQRYLELFVQESSGAKEAVDILLNEGKFKWQALTTALGFTETLGFSDPSLPSSIEFKKSIHEQAENKVRSKGISFEEALNESNKEHNGALQTRITDIRHELVNLIAGHEYAKQKREGKDVTYNDTYKKLEKKYNNWSRRDPIKFLDEITNEFYKYNKNRTGTNFNEEYSKAIRDIDSFLIFYDEVFKEEYKRGTSKEYSYEKKSAAFLSKKEYVDTLQREGYLDKIEKAEGRVAEAQEEMVRINLEAMNEFTKYLTKHPGEVVGSDKGIKLVYENGNYRVVYAGSEPIKEMEEKLSESLKLRVFSDKPVDDIDTWVNRGFLAEREERFGELRPNMINTNVPPIIGGMLNINLTPVKQKCPICGHNNDIDSKKCEKCNFEFTNQKEQVEKFDPSKEYDYSSINGLEYIGKISGVKSYEDPVMMEKIKYLIRLGRIRIE